MKQEPEMKAEKSKKSARGLFRATGKKAKRVMVDLIDGEPVYEDEREQDPDHFYPTEPIPTRSYLSVESHRLSRFPLIWENAAGDGRMAVEIERAGHAVVCSDLVDRGCGAEIKSFYDYRQPLARAIVTNPPFKECEAKAPWIQHALGTLGVEYMALLLPWAWPGAGNKSTIWSMFPPARVYLMRWRIPWDGRPGNPSNDAWYVWDGKTAEGDTRMLMLDKKDVNQTELF